MRTLLLTSIAVVVAACGGSGPPPPSPPPAPPLNGAAPAPTSAATGAPSTAPPQEGAAGHKLVVAAAACWFGGVWSEAEGADTPETRKSASEARCHDLNKRVYGTDDKEHYEQLRALEANAVDDLKSKVEDLAKVDDAAHKDALSKLVVALAAAKKEEMLARRAGDRVKRDLAKEPDKLTADEAAAVAPLKSTSALEALMKLDAGDLTNEAHALAVMSAMERSSIAKGLPKHLKIYSVSGPFQLLFGVAPPAVPEDATKPLKPGTWLAYMIDAAKAAGHPVPATAKTPLEKEPAAWAGVLEGMHDKLVPDADKISDTTPLKPVVAIVLRRLEHEYNAERDVLRQNAATPTPTPPKK
jgi:hypothetical protein